MPPDQAVSGNRVRLYWIPSPAIAHCVEGVASEELHPHASFCNSQQSWYPPGAHTADLVHHFSLELLAMGPFLASVEAASPS